MRNAATIIDRSGYQRPVLLYEIGKMVSLDGFHVCRPIGDGDPELGIRRVLAREQPLEQTLGEEAVENEVVARLVALVFRGMDATMMEEIQCSLFISKPLV